METILTIQNLHKRYGGIQALKNVSFEIKKGHVYGILGPNGSGKSTTLGIVLSVVNKTLGEYSWFDGKIQTHEALKKVGAIIERPNFYPYMYGLWFNGSMLGNYGKKTPDKLKFINQILKDEQLNGSLRAATNYQLVLHHVWRI